jgi:hypothetical protein
MFTLLMRSASRRRASRPATLRSLEHGCNFGVRADPKGASGLT